MASDLSGAALLYRSGEERNFPIPDCPEARIGFEASNEIALPFPGVSRRHAKLSFDGETYWIEDTGSSNGTFLNGRRVTAKYRLEHLDVVAFGRNTRLVFARKRMRGTRATRRGIQAAWLETLDGPDIGARRELPRGTITIGRSPAANVTAQSNLISKLHARLERSGLQLLVIDLHSSNGTFVNGEKVDSKVLANGDILSLGAGRTYRIHLDEGEIETGESLPPSPNPSYQKLPTDWKTRIEWSPEDLAALEEARKSSLGPTETALSAEDAEKAGAQPIPPADATRVLEPSPPSELAAGRPRPAPERPAKEPVIAADALPRAAVLPAPKPAGAPPSDQPRFTVPHEPPIATAPSLSASAPSPRAPESRIVLTGEGRAFPIGLGEHLIGRVPACAVRLEGRQISRRHARLRINAGGVILEDLGSANGTFVNGIRIVGEQSLKNGDIVSFGDKSFRVQIAP